MGLAFISFTPQQPGLHPQSGHVGFMVSKVALGQDLSKFSFPLSILIQPIAPYSLIISSLMPYGPHTDDAKQTNKQTKQQIPWPESASELCRPSERRLLAKLVPTFADRGCHVVSVTDPYARILRFLDRRRYFFFQVALQLYSRG
jgi:hypothetical protein